MRRGKCESRAFEKPYPYSGPMTGMVEAISRGNVEFALEFEVPCRPADAARRDVASGDGAHPLSLGRRTLCLLAPLSAKKKLASTSSRLSNLDRGFPPLRCVLHR